MAISMIDSVEGMQQLLDCLRVGNAASPILYMDLEGTQLSRHGTLSIMTIFTVSQTTVYLVDVKTLGETAFTTKGTNGLSLKSVLESKDITKVFFDIRNDSDALFGLFGISVAGIEDLQLMELASRRSDRKCVNGLARCIERDSGLGYAEQLVWKATKDRGRKLFAPEEGGSYDVFDQRPLTDDIKRYCAQDVTVMPRLRDIYGHRICDAWWNKIDEETAARIRQSQGPSYNGKGRHMALSPPDWRYWLPTRAQSRVFTRFRQEDDGMVTRSLDPSSLTLPSLGDSSTTATASDHVTRGKDRPTLQDALSNEPRRAVCSTESANFGQDSTRLEVLLGGLSIAEPQQRRYDGLSNA